MQKSRRKSKIAIIGLGYVGLPLAVQFIYSGFQVMGIDKDEFKIKSVQEGHSYINDLTDSALRKYVLHDIPKIVSGVTEECLKRITNLYSRVFKKIIPVSSTEVAEITKLSL
ncbi:MAG: UDP-glucose:GDP-mannose dehydrogenase [Bacilli bacterium]|nr:UDP-glucose:GDP-mannose dehydrogenase [Bacilli bacterium]